MGLFDTFFGKKSEAKTEKNNTWHPLSEIDQLNDVLEQSVDQPQLIFKHSTKCGVSTVAKKNLEAVFEQITPHADIHIVNIIEDREVSNKIASELNVRHESPQLIKVHQQEILWDISHGKIQPQKVLELL